MRSPSRSALALWFLVLSSPLTAIDVAWAQQFSEDFEDVGSNLGGPGPINLINLGWDFSVQSTQSGGGAWQEGPECNGCSYDWPAHDGSHYLAVGHDIALDLGDAGSAWAILPDVGQTAGSQLTFQLRGFPNFTDVIQVRYAPSGGTNTGRDAFDVGDFTELLFEDDLWTPCEFWFGCPMDDEWYFVQLEVPGPGRLAFRYHIPSQAGGTGSHVGIDAVEIGTGISEPPFPAAGETVHWPIEGSPYLIPNERTIPAGGSVIVDAGVHVDFAPDKEVLVQGELRHEGVDGQPVVFMASDQTSGLMISDGGMVTLDQAEIACHINVAAGNIFGTPAGELIATDTLFHAPAILTGTLLGHARALLVIHDCTFEDVKLVNTHCQADIRNTTFVNAGQSGVLLQGTLFLDGVSLDNSQLHIGAPRGPQPMYLNNITATNYTQGGGLLLTGGQNYLLGPDNVIQNNLYPIEFGFDIAGILPGSVVPSSGNTKNYITDGGNHFDPSGNIVWAPLDVPYVVEEWRFMGATRVLPGATVQFKPGAGFGIEFASDLIALGEPGAPVTFEGFGGGNWDGLTYLFIGSGARLDHSEIRDAETAAALVETTIKIDNCRFEDNQVGVSSGGHRAFIRGSRFQNNQTAIESPFNADGVTNPNSFAGNNIAVAGDINDSAIGNWWGDSSGPNASGNPGAGDTIAGPVVYAPFLTAPPARDNHPPTVRLTDSPLPAYVPGTTTVFHWSVEDDDAVVSQRILFSDFGHYTANFELVADDLAPDVRSFEFVIPDVGLDVANAQQAIRVEAVDARGQVGWDEQTMYISVADLEGEIEFTNDFTQPFEPGDSIDLTWNVTTELSPELTSTNASILLDHDSEFVPYGVPGSLMMAMPDVSTDSARVMLTVTGGLNRTKLFFSPEFTIRPDSRIGDAPPTVTLTSPAGGSFAGGATVPVTWTASDDESLHSFTLMASYDGGQTWHHITTDLPGDQTSYSWTLPASTGIDDVRLRIVAHDIRFQNTSDTVAISISTLGDLNGDGIVGPADLATLLDSWGPCTDCPADFNADGVVGPADLALLLAMWGS